jgi:very-short-patch-repair endonuclease
MYEFLDENGKIKQKTWSYFENHKTYIKWLSEELGYRNPENWYDISAKLIENNKGSGLLQLYKKSPVYFVKTLVKIIYPEYKWLDWKFKSTIKGFWQKIDNQKLYADWLGKELGYTKLEDWYVVTQKIIIDNHGRRLIKIYNGSPIQFLRGVYPDYKWLEWKLIMVSNGFWKDINNQKLYADWLGKELGYTKLEDWYGVTQNAIKNNCGSGILHLYNDSPIKFLKAVYPDYDWLEWKLSMVSNCFWQDINNQKLYANWLGKELGYTKLEDWYGVTQNAIRNNYGCGLLSYYFNNSPIRFLRGVYPDYDWKEHKFCKYKTEDKLYNVLITIYPTTIRQFKQDWCKKINHLQFDFCIPENKIIIELDGRQHFQQVSNWSSPESQFENDKYKEKCANDNGYSVIRIIQQDVLDDAYDWFKELCDVIEEIKNNNDVSNVYFDRNEEYSGYHII